MHVEQEAVHQTFAGQQDHPLLFAHSGEANDVYRSANTNWRGSIQILSAQGSVEGPHANDTLLCL